MAKNFAQYDAKRRARLSDEGREALKVFSEAYLLGDALGRARREASMTQVQVSEISGVQQADISRIERGTVTPNVDTLLRIVESLGARLVIEFPDHAPRHDYRWALTTPSWPVPGHPERVDFGEMYRVMKQADADADLAEQSEQTV